MNSLSFCVNNWAKSKCWFPKQGHKLKVYVYSSTWYFELIFPTVNFPFMYSNFRRHLHQYISTRWYVTKDPVYHKRTLLKDDFWWKESCSNRIYGGNISLTKKFFGCNHELIAHCNYDILPAKKIWNTFVTTLEVIITKTLLVFQL